MAIVSIFVSSSCVVVLGLLIDVDWNYFLTFR